MSAIARASWDALGTGVHVLLDDEAALPKAEATVRALLADVDATYSRFRADSELTALNAAAGRRTRVSPLLFEAIESALWAAEATGGAVDPTIGHAIRLLGYDRDFALLPSDAGSSTVRVERVPGWQVVELDAAVRSVRMPARVALDLGSTGKALAADRAARAAHEATGAAVLVSLGGDIATAGTAPRHGWQILCTDDSRTDPRASGEVIAIHAGAVATSSTAVRRWTNGGIVRHHIVDPETGLAADGPWRTATVVARTCVEANAAATSAIVLGERAVEWLVRTGVPARLTDREGQVTRVGAWPVPLPAASAA